jgi:hypothetical protein
VVDFVSEAATFAVESLVLLVDPDSGFRLSLIYQPDPLNTIPTGWKTFRMGLPHSGHSVSAASENF